MWERDGADYGDERAMRGVRSPHPSANHQAGGAEMEVSLTLTLPVPPSANRYWRSFVNKRTRRAMVVRSAEANAYRKEVQKLGVGIEPIPRGMEVFVQMTWYRAARRGDLDNRIKVMLDALEGIAYEDDAQVRELHAWREEDKENPRVEVTVREQGNAE